MDGSLHPPSVPVPKATLPICLLEKEHASVTPLALRSPALEYMDASRQAAPGNEADQVTHLCKLFLSDWKASKGSARA